MHFEKLIIFSVRILFLFDLGAERLDFGWVGKVRRGLDVTIDQVLGAFEPTKVHLKLDPGEEGLKGESCLRLMNLHGF